MNGLRCVTAVNNSRTKTTGSFCQAARCDTLNALVVAWILFPKARVDTQLHQRNREQQVVFV